MPSGEKYNTDGQSGGHQEDGEQHKEHVDLSALAEWLRPLLLLVHGEQSQGGAVGAAQGLREMLLPARLHHPAQHVHLHLHVVDHVGDAADLPLHGAVLVILQAERENLALSVAEVRQAEGPGCNLAAPIWRRGGICG